MYDCGTQFFFVAASRGVFSGLSATLSTFGTHFLSSRATVQCQRGEPDIQVLWIQHAELLWYSAWTSLTNISQLGWLFPIYGTRKHVPNHQPVLIVGISWYPTVDPASTCYPIYQRCSNIVKYTILLCWRLQSRHLYRPLFRIRCRIFPHVLPSDK